MHEDNQEKSCLTLVDPTGPGTRGMLSFKTIEGKQGAATLTYSLMQSQHEGASLLTVGSQLSGLCALGDLPGQVQGSMSSSQQCLHTSTREWTLPPLFEFLWKRGLGIEPYPHLYHGD